MSKIKNLTELAIALDITSRIAVAALAKSMSSKEIDVIFDSTKRALEPVYEGDKLNPLIEGYRDGVQALKKVLDE